MLVGQADQLLELGQRRHRAGGVARRAEKEDLHFPPGLGGHGVDVGAKAALGGAVQVEGLAAGQQGGALVDLVEGVGHRHPGGAGAVECRLDEGEDRLPGAVDRQHLALGVEPREPEAPRRPAADRLAQLGKPGGGRVAGELGLVLDQGGQRRREGGVLGLADGQRHVGQPLGGRHAGLEGGELLEGVGLEGVEIGVHGYPGAPRRPWPRAS